MSLDLNKLAKNLDEALSNETTETLTKFLNDKRMSNDKQTAVEWLIEKLTNKQNGVFDGFPYLSVDEIYEQAKEMEKKQSEDAELRSKEIIIIKHTEHEGGNK